ncbi:MAG: carboxypeptidase regulatory-like domain-containing protein [Gemmatimonadaceae bacterium]|nr:carboxypeptidase regulatory-like domain-containing protein [Gemmatimonadaceae bacterium]
MLARSVPCLAITALGLLVALAVPARAQQILGTVLRSDGATPAPGVLVVATDTAHRVIARAITRGSGDFALFVDSATTLTVRLLRPGFEDHVLPSQRLTTDEVVDLVATLDDQPVARPAWKVGASSCKGSKEDRAQVALLLEEARKTLDIVQSRIGDRDLEARAVLYDHRTAKNGEDTLRTMLRRVQGAPPETFRTTTVQELEKDGFFANIAGERVYRAPSAAILADPWFTERHCFTLALERDVVPVLRFRPTREARNFVEISGSYRFNAQTLALSRVEFQYEGLKADERSPLVAGMLEIAALRSGDHVITSWEQRFPLLGYRTVDGVTTFVRSSTMLTDVTGYRSLGGFMTAVGREGSTIWQRDPITDAIPASRAATRCAERAVGRTTAVAEGKLPVDDSTMTASGIVLRAVWNEPVIIDRTTFGAREHVRETMTDEDGGWILCDLPPDRSYVLKWEVQGDERTQSVAPATRALNRVPPRVP